PPPPPPPPPPQPPPHGILHIKVFFVMIDIFFWDSIFVLEIDGGFNLYVLSLDLWGCDYRA
ncbi:hypothetical protein ACVGXH_10695, partial [Enterobacter intestinihominis]